MNYTFSSSLLINNICKGEQELFFPLPVEAPSRFHINLKAGQDIALHINPRGQEQIVVRNSFLNGSWGPEERELPFNPFQPGQYFELSIRCGNHRFKVYVNGQPFFNYAHRYRNFPQIDTLQIDGDVVLSYIQC
uniref:Galectin n=1 Tax=Naja naja TaxID=35670 RepID=A0A8C6Y4A3_NAJNA